MAIDVDAVFTQMLSAGADAFGPGWEEAKAFARIELRTIAQRIDDIGEGLEHGDFDLPTAKMLLAMQVNLAVAAIAGATTLVVLAVEKAIDAILGVVRDLVNGSLGVPLILAACRGPRRPGAADRHHRGGRRMRRPIATQDPDHGQHRAAGIALVAGLLLSLASGATRAEDRILGVGVTCESMSEVLLTVRYQYAGAHGDNVFMSAKKAEGGEPSRHYAVRPAPVAVGGKSTLPHAVV